MSENEHGELIDRLAERFAANPERHPRSDWAAVKSALGRRRGALAALAMMEESGGEPDVVELGAAGAREASDTPDRDTFTFADCSGESPEGRRSLCYDRAALESRRTARPVSSALDMAAAMGATILSEDEYRRLQELGEFDMRTSSWVLTPAPVRELGGALFMDRRFGRVFVYHNGAESYFGARGFRAKVLV